jgi:leucyl aminopeptidase
LPVSDQTTISFANLSLPQEGVAVVLAEEGPKLAPSAKELDKASKGLLSRAAAISGFKGKRDTTVDLLAPAGMKFARLVLMGTGKTADYTAEDWLNLGGTVRGLLTGKEGPSAHIVLDGAGKGIAPEAVANFALGASLRGYQFRNRRRRRRRTAPPRTTRRSRRSSSTPQIRERRPSSMEARALSPTA